jgi:hypothetical protein
MARLDPTEFHQLVYEDLRARAGSADRNALMILVLNGLLVGILTLGPALRQDNGARFTASAWWLVVGTLAALLLAWFFAARILFVRVTLPILGESNLPSYPEYRRAMRRLTDDGALEELARRTWELQRILRGKHIWLNTALGLTFVGLLLFGLSAFLPPPYFGY